MPRTPRPPVNRQTLLAHMSGEDYEPTSGRELVRQLRVGKEGREAFRLLLRDLVNDGSLRRLKGSRYALAREKRLMVGKLHGHRDGYGFVIPPDGSGPDVYVRKRHMNGALHRDRVQVQVTQEKGGGRSEGKITKILERARHRVTGILGRRQGEWIVKPYGSEPYQEVRLPDGATGDAQDGMVVGVELFRYPSGEEIPDGKVTEVMGSPEEPGMDLKIIIRKYGLRDEFPQEVLDAAAAIPVEVQAGDREGREDFRELTTVTIDGETARDFDDAISISKHPDGSFTLWVHIADVSHYVTEGSLLDQEARERGTSVYFPDRAIHMLPAALATGICSLKPDVERLCQTCIMEIDATGKLKSSRVVKGVIRSDRRMTYTEVAACLGGDATIRTTLGSLVS